MFLTALAVMLAALSLFYFALGRTRTLDMRRSCIGIFVWGIIMIIPVMIFEMAVMYYFYKYTLSIWLMIAAALLCTALPEEALMMMCLYANTRRTSYYRTRRDAVIFAVFLFAGLSFAETVFVAISPVKGMPWLRYLTSLPIQATVGALAGWFYGRSKIYPDLYRVHNAMAVIIPALVHAVFEFSILAAIYNKAWGLPLLAATLIPAFGLCLFFIIRILFPAPGTDSAPRA